MAKDPYKYFRLEAKELVEGLTQGVIQLEKGPFVADVFSKLLRLAHTLKGAARVVKQPRIAEVAHEMEDLLTALRDTAATPNAEQAATLLRQLDEINARVRQLDPAPPVEKPQPARPAAEEPIETVRVELQEMDALLRDVTEAGVQLGALRRTLGVLDRVQDLAKLLHEQLGGRPGDQGALRAAAAIRARSISEELRTELDHFQRAILSDVERIDTEVTEVRGVAYRLRLVPVRSVFLSLELAVQDAARSTGRFAELETSGGEVRLEASVLAALRGALQHVVRNAVTHGIESEAERVAAGKPPAGQIRLLVERRGNHVVFRCQDDGRGVDVAAVRRVALSRGLITEAQAAGLDRGQVVRLVLASGLSTRPAVTELSGRGVGLDVVSETLSRLKGQVEISSPAGQGTTVELTVPVSLASFPGLLVEAGGTVASIPLEAIQETLRVHESDIAPSPEGDSILHQNQVVPIRELGDALGRATSRGGRTVRSAVIVRTGAKVAAIVVDGVLGTANIVMRSLPPYLAADPVVAGISLDADGNPQLVLDPAGLVANARVGGRAARAAPKKERLPILVVDDSLTTRMLEKSILESAGYWVEVAMSAEEALVKARERRHALFLCDVEMPGMDGFTFVAQTRADPVLRETPAILVTSRNAPEDKKRGEAAGAAAYIVKSEFDQVQLLQIIRSLVE